MNKASHDIEEKQNFLKNSLENALESQMSFGKLDTDNLERVIDKLVLDKEKSSKESAEAA